MLSVEKARQILGKQGERLTDKEIQAVLLVLQQLCNKVIDGVVISNYEN